MNKLLRAGDRWIARALSVGLALGAFVLLLPAAAIIAVLVRIILGAPVLFVQVRPGLHGKPFRMYKFRSMSNATDERGQLLPDSQRLGRFGRWLRATSLDELPELWNVIRGEMTLVGPRPLLVEYLPLYSQTEARRHEVLPGITGWAQARGRNELPWRERLALDVWYVDNRSLALDARILAMTIGLILRRRGITAAGHATMPSFTGTDANTMNPHPDVTDDG